MIISFHFILFLSTVLECLYRRSQDNQYCTKAGITLVSINPFKEIPGLYDADVVNRYRNNDVKVGKGGHL